MPPPPRHEPAGTVLCPAVTPGAGRTQGKVSAARSKVGDALSLCGPPARSTAGKTWGGHEVGGLFPAFWAQLLEGVWPCLLQTLGNPPGVFFLRNGKNICLYRHRGQQQSRAAGSWDVAPLLLRAPWLRMSLCETLGQPGRGDLGQRGAAAHLRHIAVPAFPTQHQGSPHVWIRA